jgi:hypothetical protein
MHLISSSCKLSGEDSDVGDEDPCDGASDRRLEVLSRPAAAAEPSECPLDRPATGQHFKADGLLRTLDDLDGPSSDFAQYIAELIAGIAAVGKNVTQPGIKRANGGREANGSIAILDIGRVNLQADQMALSVYDNVALAVLDFLARIKAVWTAAFRGLHHLAVDYPSYPSGQALTENLKRKN